MVRRDVRAVTALGLTAFLFPLVASAATERSLERWLRVPGGYAYCKYRYEAASEEQSAFCFSTVSGKWINVVQRYPASPNATTGQDRGLVGFRRRSAEGPLPRPARADTWKWGSDRWWDAWMWCGMNERFLWCNLDNARVRLWIKSDGSARLVRP
jgi:hypothetical protein